MKVSRALALYDITLDELVEALRAGAVKSRERWGKEELIRPHRWHPPPKPLEALDQEVNLDPESLQETFGDAAEAPARHGSAGRKSGGNSQGSAIVDTFRRMVEDGSILIENRGRWEAARKVQVKFPNYSVKYIAALITLEYRRLEGTRTKH